MMQALAAETAAGHSEPFYASPEFWVFVAFVILVAGGGRMVFAKITQALDERAAAIKQQIEEATHLREEAQDLLATYERKQRQAASEAKELLDEARMDADRLGQQAALALEKSLKRQEKLALERIAQAEVRAMEEVRDATINIALEASRRVLAEKVKGKLADALIKGAIKELPKKLH
ncbi:MAG TPA: F0F1 ATP synthase subunit B [Rhodospirillales bacterium]|jgi:F-type H+-transporting ATPase subunit b|nr:F0F1 ATP synthase subunit B [Rhodospirillales bacterium]